VNIFGGKYTKIKKNNSFSGKKRSLKKNIISVLLKAIKNQKLNNLNPFSFAGRKIIYE